MSEDLLWVEKYRPSTVNDCILPERIKAPFLNFVREKQFPNLLLSGGPGTGKTTIAKALCNDLGYDSILINASDERNIDVVRGTIKDFASTISLAGNKKAIILDESDGLNPASAQPALRAAIEEFSTTRFILTCNYKNRLIEPIHSRTTTIDFNLTKQEKKDTIVLFLKRVLDILKTEHVKYDTESVASIVKKFFPDNRRILMELQKYAIGGTIDSGIVTAAAITGADELLKAVKGKDLAAARQWIVNNADSDPALVFRKIYDTFYTEVKPESVPQLVMLIADRQYKSAFVSDQEINMVALVGEILQGVEFK